MFIDEAQCVKRTNQLYILILNLNCPKILMTGTPLQNTIHDYYDLLHIVDADNYIPDAESLRAVEAGYLKKATVEQVDTSCAHLKYNALLTTCVHRRTATILADLLPMKFEYTIQYQVPDKEHIHSIFKDRQDSIVQNEGVVIDPRIIPVNVKSIGANALRSC